jgi:predicted methyltransferase
MAMFRAIDWNRAFAAVAIILMCVAARPVRAQAVDVGRALDAALAGDHRNAANKARDRYRHPKETLEFFGLRPDMTVVEIWPGGGWYTEILAPVVRDRGKLYAALYGASPPFPYQTREMESFRAKLASAPAVYDRVTITALGFATAMDGGRPAGSNLRQGELAIAPSGSADLVVTFRNIHNFVQEGYGPPNAPELAFKAFFDALKPGGVLGVVDHRWPDPATEDPRSRNGYISEQRVIAFAEAAGFELAGRSDVNRNPLDTHDYPEGVWALPPDLALGERDRAKYLAIGESDRLTLKFVKPD